MSNPPKHHDDGFAIVGFAIVMRPRPNGAGKKVVDRSAFLTAILHDRGAGAVMGRLFVGKGMAIRAGKPLRMQSIEKIPIALLFVEKIGNRKPHHGRLLRR